LNNLKTAGLDLEKYGQREHCWHIALPEDVAKHYFYVQYNRKIPQFRRYCTVRRLVSFAYGPSQDDWQFW
jgi:hypothetical protein